MAFTSLTTCGICHAPKSVKTYNRAPVGAGVRMATVMLCVRCDLTPEPPKERNVQ